MRLKGIIENLEIVNVKNFKNYNIKSITHISKDVINDSMFVSIKGNNFNGNDYIDDVIEKGAKCIVTEEELEIKNVTVLVVKDIRSAMSVIAKNFYHKSVDGFKMIGIVGTAGKTSTSLILSQILSKNDINVGVIGTNGIFIGNIRLENTFTTPDPLELHYVFYQMKLMGVTTVVMEVSAQAIFYKKVFGIGFDICVFTNISKEHLDFFGSLEDYARVKMNFFNACNMKECVVNIDDFYGRELAYKTNIPCVSYGVLEPANSFAMNIELGLDRTKFVANILDDVITCDTPLVGEYSVYNVLASLTVAKMLGIDSEGLKKSISNLDVIDGRFNVYNIKGKKIIIDFAHTPDSIDKLMSHIKHFSDSKIWGLFGCVGYSNREKRLEMGSSVAKYSDYVVITSDNPCKTVFEDICKDVIDGIGEIEYACIEDRKSAINYAFEKMNEGDVLVLIGKGAENFQKIGDVRIPYSDKECVLELMEK